MAKPRSAKKYARNHSVLFSIRMLQTSFYILFLGTCDAPEVTHFPSVPAAWKVAPTVVASERHQKISRCHGMRVLCSGLLRPSEQSVLICEKKLADLRSADQEPFPDGHHS